MKNFILEEQKPVMAQVWAQVKAQVEAKVWDQVEAQAEAQVWYQVRDQVWDSLSAITTLNSMCTVSNGRQRAWPFTSTARLS